MVTGDYSGISTLGMGAVYSQRLQPQSRPVTLEAERDPQTPHQYRVATKQQIIPSPEAPTEVKSSGKRSSQSNDPVSRAFLAVANYSSQPTYHRIDVIV